MERINRILRNQRFQEHLRKNQAAETDRIFCHHDMGHFLDVARIGMILNLQEGLGIPAGIPHEEAGARIAPGILAECGYTAEEIREIEEAIALHRDSGTEKRADLAGVLYRADKASRACFACQASS